MPWSVYPKASRRTRPSPRKNKAGGMACQTKSATGGEKDSAWERAWRVKGKSTGVEYALQRSAMEYARKTSPSEKFRKKDYFFTQKSIFFHESTTFAFANAPIRSLALSQEGKLWHMADARRDTKGKI